MASIKFKFKKIKKCYVLELGARPDGRQRMSESGSKRRDPAPEDKKICIRK